MKSTKSLLVAAVILLFIAPVLIVTGCQKKAETPTEPAVVKEEATVAPFALAVVVPGVTAGSPLYEQLVEGAQQVIDQYPQASMKVVELGFNQSEWGEKMTSVVATGRYDAVLTSNPSMPFVCMELASQFPEQKFLFVDGFIEGHPQMASFLYNQVEQSYMLGHLAGLISTSDMPGANADLKIGIIVAQEYPALNKMIVPGFEQGAQAVNSGITLDYRVLGNWYDANKAGELAKSMIDAGVDVIGVICGGAATGVFEVCADRNKYVMYWDDNSYAKAPGVIAGCGALHQKMLVAEVVDDAINGKVEYGTGVKLNARDGYIEFVDTDPNYLNTIPESIQAEQKKVVDSIMSGTLVLEVPEL
ncbi:MAG: BMP family ABC transporter substrate-binding protein [Spirochaetales bacterium]|uniref:BMP family ABC transporter substrate-binding protein n=1 Tax=Candidatus Thalassospirochaeta sargassi TaxID=3119039 RepID=A0AAJ1MJJ4_9SPIO|nr:BMP family ABC transporter substrate-binding protein [Spirochaetales bacterium]